MSTPCPPLVLAGIEQFNRREFFQCHETLEEFWQEYTGADREFIQGLIQVAVAYHHLLGNNSVGAIKLIRRALPRLQPYQPQHMGMESTPLIESATNTLQRLEEGESALECIPKITLVLT
jgi:predicted metal-dependent hydrolase